MQFRMFSCLELGEIVFDDCNVGCLGGDIMGVVILEERGVTVLVVDGLLIYDGECGGFVGGIV